MRSAKRLRTGGSRELSTLRPSSLGPRLELERRQDGQVLQSLFSMEVDTVNSLLANWKTTASSILTVTLVTTVGLLAYPPVIAHPQWVAVLGGVQVVGKIWIGLLQNDAPPNPPQPVGPAQTKAGQ